MLESKVVVMALDFCCTDLLHFTMPLCTLLGNPLFLCAIMFLRAVVGKTVESGNSTDVAIRHHVVWPHPGRLKVCRGRVFLPLCSTGPCAVVFHRGSSRTGEHWGRRKKRFSCTSCKSARPCPLSPDSEGVVGPGKQRLSLQQATNQLAHARSSAHECTVLALVIE